MSRFPALPRVVATCLLSLVLAVPALAYTPRYTVKKTIYASSLYPGTSTVPMTITGLNSSGRLVGYYSYQVKANNHTSTYIQALVWDEPTQSFLNAAASLYCSYSMATCVNDAGAVAGVYWTDNVYRQLGFVYQNGVATTISSPDDSDVDAIIGINASGQVIGTYMAGFGYKRAFLWDGSQAVDLGDLGTPGEPSNAFVWPSSINAAGQVVGTIYTHRTEVPLPGQLVTDPSQAFQWSNGSMTSLPGYGGEIYTRAIANNDLGMTVGSTYHNTPFEGTSSTTGALWSGSDFYDFGIQDTLPYAVNPDGLVTGTTYVPDSSLPGADRSLHLFNWLPTGTLNDLGLAQLAPNDENFQLTSVNQRGDVAGFVTDALGRAQVFVRIAGTGTANLASLVPPGSPPLDCAADDTDGRRVLLNDAGLLAYSGYDHTGKPVVVLLTPDADNDGLPDNWELEHFGNLAQGGGDDPDGDGLSNLQEYLQGSNPTDYFNGATPVLTMASANPQTGNPGQLLPAALAVRVADAAGNAYANASVIFTVISGGGSLQVTNSATAGSTRTVHTDGNGQARAYFRLPETQQATCKIRAQVTGLQLGATASTQIFTALSDDGSGSFGSAFAPTNFISQGNLDGSLNMSWENHTDDQTPIEIEIKQADGTWKLVATLAPGTTSYYYPAHQ